jgi:hypothetical protein
MMGWLGKSLKKIENVDLKPRNIYISKLHGVFKQICS